ncbi:MAG TPA: aldo/keto reductase, partial [Ktedonobacterales bacterium]|nr:aldo/keto reductase [Ktedonobacterales bacterium]
TMVISTKVYFPMSDEVNDQGLSRKHIMESIDRSLQRINTDYVDIYFCHRPDLETPLLETARAMDDLIHQGKVLYWGTSEWSGAQLQEVCDTCERYGLYKPQTEQPQYSMLHRERVEDEVVPVALREGLGLVVWSPLAQGMLTGKYDEGIPGDSRFAQEDWLRERYVTEHNRQIVRRLATVAEKLEITRGQLALAWVLHQPAVSGAIVGATKPDQMQENLRATEITLPDDVLKEIEGILTA